MKNSYFFRVNITGQIESANFYEGDAIYCKYQFVYGDDWKNEEVINYFINIGTIKWTKSICM